MKRASLIAAALAVVLSLAACGGRDNGSVNSGSTTTNGTAAGGLDGATGANGTDGVNGTGSHDTLGDDLADGARDVMRDVERGVDGLLEVSPQSATGASTTSFQRMLNNARVHDVDGVLTDGENSRW